MNRNKLSVDEFIALANARINNAISDATIAAHMATYGYNADRMLVGKALLDAARALCANFDKEHGEVDAAYAIRNASRVSVELMYTKHEALARIALKDEKAAILALHLKKKKTAILTLLIARMHSFYTNLVANPSWMEKMADFNVSAEELETAHKGSEALFTAENSILIEKGEAQQSTVDRNEKLDELNEWLNEFESIANLALAGETQLLEKLGIVVKS